MLEPDGADARTDSDRTLAQLDTLAAEPLDRRGSLRSSSYGAVSRYTLRDVLGAGGMAAGPHELTTHRGHRGHQGQLPLVTVVPAAGEPTSVNVNGIVLQ